MGKEEVAMAPAPGRVNVEKIETKSPAMKIMNQLERKATGIVDDV